MSHSYPTRESELIVWLANFKALIVGNPTAYGLTDTQSDTLGDAVDEFDTAYQTANDPTTRSPRNIEQKNELKDACMAVVRNYAAIIKSTPGMTDTKLIALGLPTREEPTPVPAPTEAPAIEILDAQANAIEFLLYPSTGTSRRGKPEGVQGATVLSYVGQTAPLDPAVWKFEGNTTRNKKTIVFPEDLAPGTKVWLTAFWFNRKAQSGPPCDPVPAYIQFGGMRRAA
ncbi:MAG: hypothetical protein AAGE65_15320 [Planctomycetota bacterium]